MISRYHYRIVIGTVAVLVWAASNGTSLSAQSHRAGTTIGIGFGPFAAYPEEFEGGGCDGRYAGFDIAARRALSDVVAVEGSVTWTGSLATSCALAIDALSRPAPLDGETYRRTSLAPEIPGETFWATRFGAALTPWSIQPVTPFVRVTGGRLWSKELWTWTLGAGLRYGFGRQALVLDIERWNLAYDITREVWVYRANADDELESREVVRRRPGPWFVRLGWELGLRAP